MKSVIEIDEHKATVSFDPEIGLFRGEFLGLTGGADFYSEASEKLPEEGRISLRVYFDICCEHGITPVHNPASD